MVTGRADRIIAYCIGIAQEFQSRISRMQVFVKHNLSTGNANEVILREFLSNHAPSDFYVGQGFMCDPFEEEKVSRQCDILIYDQSNYPMVYSDGPVRIVWPESVRMVIEVKTNFNRKDTHGAIENISTALKTNKQVYGVVFAFKSPSLKTVLENIKDYPHSIEDDNKPLAILLLDKGVIIHRWLWTRRIDINSEPTTDLSAYGVRIEKDKKKNGAIVIAFLLLLFFEKLGVSKGLYGTDAINTAMKMLEDYTDRLPDVKIGQKP